MGQSVEQKIRALYFEKTGSLLELKLGERPLPVPAPGEALVQVKAAAINPSDAKNVMGKFPFTTLPRIPGRIFPESSSKAPLPWWAGKSSDPAVIWDSAGTEATPKGSAFPPRPWP
jgi:hypothetical protein